jgi:hypothetical protein
MDAMRCPHCASHLAIPPTCWTCGTPLDAPVQHVAMRELEPTRYEHAEVDAPRLPGLLPVDSPDLTTPVLRLVVPCPSCGHEQGADGPCEACGARREHRRVAHQDDEPVSMTGCRHCGLRNPLTRALCLGCGSRMAS